MNNALILLAHGSTDPRWQEPFTTMETRLRQRMTTPVRLAYMELCDPLLEDVAGALINDGKHRVDILPLFFAAGRHLREDVPAQLDALRRQYAMANLTLLDPVGQHPAFIEAIMAIVGERESDPTLVQGAGHVQ